MQSGKGGMGSHKHRVSGHASRSPRYRHQSLREAQAEEERKKKKRTPMKASIKELFNEIGANGASTSPGKGG